LYLIFNWWIPKVTADRTMYWWKQQHKSKLILFFSQQLSNKQWLIRNCFYLLIFPHKLISYWAVSSPERACYFLRQKKKKRKTPFMLLSLAKVYLIRTFQFNDCYNWLSKKRSKWNINTYRKQSSEYFNSNKQSQSCNILCWNHKAR
jgi:hypothetical protein